MKEVHEKRKAMTQYRKKFGLVRGAHLRSVGEGAEEGEEDKSSPTEKTEFKRGGKKPRKGHWYEAVLDKQKQEKQKKLEENEARKATIKRHQKQRKRTNIRMSKRTSKGQPVMKNQIENLLSKIRRTKQREKEEGRG